MEDATRPRIALASTAAGGPSLYSQTPPPPAACHAESFSSTKAAKHGPQWGKSGTRRCSGNGFDQKRSVNRSSMAVAFRARLAAFMPRLCGVIFSKAV